LGNSKLDPETLSVGSLLQVEDQSCSSRKR